MTINKELDKLDKELDGLDPNIPKDFIRIKQILKELARLELEAKKAKLSGDINTLRLN